MHIILMFLLTITLSLSAPINKLEFKKPIVANDGNANSGKVITIVGKDLKPNKDETTLVVSEELVFSSTGFPTFDAFDHNSDGYIEFDEFAASDGKDHKSNFQNADTNNDQKLSPEEFSRLPLVVYEPEQFSDTFDEPPVVFLTPPESISRYNEREVSVKSDAGYDDGREIPDFFSTDNEETKDYEEVKEEHKEEIKPIDNKTQKTTTKTETKPDDGSHFTADDMPVKIDDEDDEEMIEMKDEDIPMEVIDDLNEENHYDIDEPKEPLEDEKKMNHQLNSIE